MPSNDPTQMLNTPQRGEQVTAAMLRQMWDKIRNSIKGGRGITIRRMGDEIMIESTARGGGTTAGTTWYTADTEAELPSASSVAETALARVTTGADAGVIFIVNPTKTGWSAINRWTT